MFAKRVDWSPMFAKRVDWSPISAIFSTTVTLNNQY
jgi:hypothetical protein